MTDEVAQTYPFVAPFKGHDKPEDLADPVAVAQDEFAADPVPKVTADPSAAPDPSPNATTIAALEELERGGGSAESNPTGFDGTTYGDPEIASEEEPEEVEPARGATRHARDGIQAGPADHPRTHHTARHA